MTTPLWQPSDGQLLKKLREQAGLDPVVLARMGSMTIHHLRGLEDGEGGDFYSPAIKAQMGRALLAKLGHVAPPAGDAVAPAAAVPSPAPPTLRLLVDRPVLSHASPRRFRAARARRKRSVLLAVSACCALVAGSAWFLASARSDPVRLGPLAASLPRPVAKTDVPPVSVAPRPTPASLHDAPLPASLQAPIQVPVQAAAVCDPDDNRPRVDYTPPEPRKAGNFVHVVADRPIRLCVLDAQRKATRLALEPGDGRSIYGVAPFMLQGELAGVRVFYQGVRVQGELSAGARVVLNEAPLR